MKLYTDTISFWDNKFSIQEPERCIESIRLPIKIENAINWISNESKTILDYGCGNGNMLFKCAARENISKCLGIDISQNAVNLAEETAILNNLENKVDFCCGEISALQKIEGNSFDGAILFNIIDNVIQNDASIILENICRIVTPNGRIIIKLNPYLTQEQLLENGFRKMDNNLYMNKEGVFLRNSTTYQWKESIEQFLKIIGYTEIYYQDFSQYERMFLLTNNK